MIIKKVPYFWIIDNTSVTANGKTKMGNVVDAVTCSRRIVYAAVTLTDHHAESFDVLAGNIAFTPDVDLIVKGKKMAVKNIGLSLCCTCNRGGDDCRIAFPRHAYR